ncbi:transposase [[Kitasatospora] papulosa]|uniref:transposase n=1 Tax=Streptomyces sp. NPDC001616 TaxID=3156648 RepID=UPI00332613CE
MPRIPYISTPRRPARPPSLAAADGAAVRTVGRRVHSWGQAQADGSEDTPLRATGASSERRCVRDLASFAHLCGAAPIPASSGRTDRHRIKRGGDSNANSVLCTIVLVCMQYDQRTRHYVARRTTENMSAKDIMRCLKRFVVREIYRHLRSTSTLGSAGSARIRS